MNEEKKIPLKKNSNSLIQTSRIAAAIFAKILSFIIGGLDSTLIFKE